MHADDILRTRGEAGDLVQIQGRGIAGEDRSGLRHRVQTLEHDLLHLQVLEHRLDDEIGAGKIIVRQCRLQHADPSLELDGIEAALGESLVVVLPDSRYALVECFLFRFEQRDRDAGVEQADRNATAHRSGPDHRRGVDRARRGARRNIEDLRRRALGEKCVAQRARFRCLRKLNEQLPLVTQAVIEGRRDGRRHRVDAFEGGGKAAGHGADGVACKLEQSVGIRIVDNDIAHARQRALCGAFARSERQRALQQIAVDDGVEQCRAAKAFARHAGAGNDHVQRGFDTDRARQPLRASGARQQTQPDLRQCYLRVRHGDAEVAAECQLQSAAHAAAADRGDDRLFARLGNGDDRRQRRFRPRLWRSEFADVCAARKQGSGAGQNNRGDRRVGLRAIDPFDDRCAQRVIQAVDWRIVERDHCHRPMQRVPVTHCKFPLRVAVSWRRHPESVDAPRPNGIAAGASLPAAMLPTSRTAYKRPRQGAISHAASTPRRLRPA